jgi:hypothetical protein
MPSLTPGQNIKNAILSDLNGLVTSGVLNSTMADDYSKLNPLDRNWPGFPCALVIPPTVSQSQYEDVATNLREYTWYVLLVTTPTNLSTTDPTYLEGLIDNVLQVFDNDVTLHGYANGGLQPAVLDPPGPVSSGSVTYVVTTVTLKAKVVTPAAVQ